MTDNKVIQLTLNNEFIDKIKDELEAMKTNHNKIVKMTSADKGVVLVIAHKDNDLKKRFKEKKE